MNQFFRAGGRPLDIAQILNKVDKNELFHITYVFNALHLILIEKLKKSVDLTKETDAIEVCSYLLNNHRVCIEKLLVSSYATHKKSVLKLLTVVVYLAPHLGRELLTTFNVAFNAETLSRYTEHNRNESERPDEDRLRTCYIYFVLAYIIDGNAILIRNILDRNELIMAIISGLVYDSEKTVTLVLNALVKFVLHSESVTKTKKIQVFSVNVVKEVLRLFEWKGPAYLAATFDKKLKAKADQFVSAEDYASVTASTYEFLRDLLSSRKYGIAFKCLGHRRTKHNAVPKRALIMIENFWENDHKANLCIDILKACPELMRTFVQKQAPRLDPFKKQNDWFKVSTFFARLIDAMSPSIIQYQVDQMNVKETTELIKEICLAPELLLQLRSKHTLKSDRLEIRHQSTRILYLMFRQCNQYLYNIEKWNVYRANEVKKIKFELINHILAHCPSVQNIILSLHLTQVNCDGNEMFEHLECILDLLLIIVTTIPSFIDTTSSVINYIKILGPIYELNREQESSTRIEFKAVKLMLALEPKALSPKTELFEQVLQSFFNVFRFGTPNDQHEAKNLLRNVFENTGLFENGSLEVDLWLQALHQLDEDNLGDVKQFLIQNIRDFDVNASDGIANRSIANEFKSTKNISEIFANIERGVALKGVLDVPTLGPFFTFLVQKFNDAKKTTNENDIDVDAIGQYIELVGIYLFHYLPMSESVCRAMEVLDHRFANYMKRWTNQLKIGKMPDDIRPKIFKKFYATFVANETVTFANIFSTSLSEIQLAEGDDEKPSENSLVVKLNEKMFNVSEPLNDETQIMLFIYAMIFCGTNLHKFDAFKSEQRQQFVDYFKQFFTILEQIDIKNSEIQQSGFETTETNGNCVGRLLKYIFGNCFYLLESFDIWCEENELTTLIFDIMRHVRPQVSGNTLDECLIHYRTKVCQQIELATQRTLETNSVPTKFINNFLDILDILNLDAENCQTIVKSLMKLKYSHFITSTNERSIYSNILAHALTRLADLKKESLDGEIVAHISDIYVHLVRNVNVEINYEVIEQALFVYLSVFYGNIGDVHVELFDVLFETKKLTKATVKLACLLFERQSNKLIERFKVLLSTNVGKKELVYPLINVGVTCNWTIDAKLMQNIYGEYRNGILKAIEKPQKAAVIYRENVISSVFLIEKCMPLNECVDFLKRTINYEGVDTFQLQIIKSIHLKILMHSENVDTIKHAYENFLTTFVHLFGLLLKRDSLDYDKINAFACIAFQWTQLKNRLLPATLVPLLAYDSIYGAANWLHLGKMCLKHAMKMDSNAATTIKRIDDTPAILLKTFAFLCNQYYKNDGKHEDAQTFFEMTVTHPNFFDIATLQKSWEVKTQLMHLLYVLVRKNATSIESDHIPVLLGAYQARMSACDQYILALLQLYERNGCDFHKYKPFMWGENALAHYSLEVSQKVKTTLFQEPPIMQMMALIDRDICENTLVNFPLWRHLDVVDQVPDTEFICHGIIGDENSNEPKSTRSNVERLIECGDVGLTAKKIDDEILFGAARRTDTLDDVYDPAFFIPIMLMSFAPEVSTSTVRPAQNGLLALTFAALSSTDKSMRLAGASALQRYRTHLECAQFVDSKLWYHLFDAIKNGLGALTVEAQKQKKNRIPRVPYVAGVFFARTINILVNPLHEMYRPLSTFLLLKNSLNFLTVPEFNVLFHSPDVNHSAHRTFILNILRDGLKWSGDFATLLTDHTFKALLGFYDSSLNSREKSLQILSVVNAAAKIPKSAKILIDLVGILSWLNAVIDNIEFYQFDMIEAICTIINNLYYSVAINRCEYTRNAIENIEQRCLTLLLKLLPKLSSRIAETAFERFVNILAKICCGPANTMRARFINEANINHLIKCTGGYATEQTLWDCAFIKDTPVAHQFCERRFSYARKLRELGIAENIVLLLTNLREIVIFWTIAQKI